MQAIRSSPFSDSFSLEVRVWESKLAYIAQQRRLEDARVAEMTEESDKKAVRTGDLGAFTSRLIPFVHIV